jgi:hypothetical protein
LAAGTLINLKKGKHGPRRALLLWLAERINALVQPNIRIS